MSTAARSSRLAEAMIAVLLDRSGADVADILEVPKRTADRWLAELRDSSELSNWSGSAIERLAAWEARQWGTGRIAAALLPMPLETLPRQGHIDAADLVRIMRSVSDSHRINASLLTELAAGLSDGRIDDHEVRTLLPGVREAQQAAAAKQAALVELVALLEGHLRRR